MRGGRVKEPGITRVVLPHDINIMGLKYFIYRVIFMLISKGGCGKERALNIGRASRGRSNSTYKLQFLASMSLFPSCTLYSWQHSRSHWVCNIDSWHNENPARPRPSFSVKWGPQIHLLVCVLVSPYLSLVHIYPHFTFFPILHLSPFYIYPHFFSFILISSLPMLPLTVFAHASSILRLTNSFI